MSEHKMQAKNNRSVLFIWRFIVDLTIIMNNGVMWWFNFFIMIPAVVFMASSLQSDRRLQVATPHLPYNVHLQFPAQFVTPINRYSPYYLNNKNRYCLTSLITLLFERKDKLIRFLVLLNILSIKV